MRGLKFYNKLGCNKKKSYFYNIKFMGLIIVIGSGLKFCKDFFYDLVDELILVLINNDFC